MNDDFDIFNKQIQVSLAAALKWGDGKLYTSDALDLDQVYLRSFTDAKDRQYHNCNACRSFLKRYGGLLVTNGVEVQSALFNFCGDFAPKHFEEALLQMARAVNKARINGIFASKLAKLGQPETNGWTHFWVQNPNVHTSPVTTAGQLMAQHRQDFLTLRRGLDEFDISVFAAVTNLMESEAAYRASKFAKQAKGYSDLKTKIAGLDQHKRDVMLFHAIANGMPPGIKSSALGTLYDDLQKGMTVVDALKRFKAVVDPRVYQQPTAAPKAGNIKRAEDIFKAMNLELSLHRRVATFDEIRERCAWAWQGASMMSPASRVVETSMPGIFSGLNNPPLKAGPNMAGVAARMSLRKFMEQRSQNVAAMEILHLDKPHPLGTITAALYPDAPPLFAWGSTYGWYRWFAVPGKDFGLGDKANVLGVLDLPSTWFSQDSPHKGLMFVLEGASDFAGAIGAGIPAEGLRSELHEVKRTIVAHALQGKLQGAPGNQAAGLIVRKDDFKPFVIRADGIDYGITSWE